MTRIKGFLIITLVLISVLYGASIYEYQKQVKKLQKDNEWLVEQILDLESKDCSWLENFYYNHIGECQCGVYEKENGYIIDGAWYEYKGEYKELFGEDIRNTLQ